MEPKTGDTQSPDHEHAVGQLAEAHSLLQELRDEISHAKLEDAILRLETALSILTTKSGGML